MLYLIAWLTDCALILFLFSVTRVLAEQQASPWMLGTLGAIVTAIFAAAKNDEAFFIVLAFIALFGLAWDVLYIAIQRWRWDRDWPTSFQVVVAVAEGAMIVGAGTQTHYHTTRVISVHWLGGEPTYIG